MSFGAGLSTSQNNQMTVLLQSKMIEKNEVKALLQSIHRMHTETILNPFFVSEYVLKDDGQDHSVFT